MKKANWAVIITAAACCLPLAQQATAKVVGDGKLEQYCAEEAMTRLNVDLHGHRRWQLDRGLGRGQVVIPAGRWNVTSINEQQRRGRPQ